jgi:hypothetical protein
MCAALWPSICIASLLGLGAVVGGVLVGMLCLGEGSEIEGIEGELGILAEVLDVVDVEVWDASEPGVEEGFAPRLLPGAGTIEALGGAL